MSKISPAYFCLEEIHRVISRRQQSPDHHREAHLSAIKKWIESLDVDTISFSQEKTQQAVK